MKVNCWEYLKCGREAGGINADELGVCPAAKERKTHGINGGINGGRACWAISGSFCCGKIQGIFAEKIINCVKCDFYHLVRDEENENYINSAKILDKLDEHD